MKKCLILFLPLFFLSCNQKSKQESAIAKESVEIAVVRFDSVFFETPPDQLQKIKDEYPLFFPEGNDDAVWIEKMQNPLWQELYKEVQKKYANVTSLKTDFETLFKHIKYYYPKTKIPKVITVISEMDYENKVIYTDSLVIVSLEMYLGKEHKFYQFPNYIKQNFEENQIMPDVVASFFRSVSPPNLDKKLLGSMVYAGKELYMKGLFLPESPANELIGYTQEQLSWCEENESYIWRYFIDKQLLYSDDQKLIPRFINPAPFSKFYLEIDNESPGKVGAYIGWQIVNSYMKNNEVSLQQLLDTNAQEIFKKSKYKPKK